MLILIIEYALAQLWISWRIKPEKAIAESKIITLVRRSPKLRKVSLFMSLNCLSFRLSPNSARKGSKRTSLLIPNLRII